MSKTGVNQSGAAAIANGLRPAYTAGPNYPHKEKLVERHRAAGPVPRGSRPRL